MPTATLKDAGVHHYPGLSGYRIQTARALGWDANRTLLDAGYLGVETLDAVHGAFTYKVPISGDTTPAIKDGLLALQRSTDPVIYTDVGKDVGTAAVIGRGKIDGLPNQHSFNTLATFSTTFCAGDGEHVAVNPVGTLANHWAPGASALAATGTTTPVQFTDAVAADEELIFAVQEASYPGPSAGSTLTAVLKSATDQVFTTPVTRITLTAIGATFGAETGVLAGAISANLWWRVDWALTGTTPTRYPTAAFAKRPSSTYSA